MHRGTPVPSSGINQLLALILLIKLSNFTSNTNNILTFLINTLILL